MSDDKRTKARKLISGEALDALIRVRNNDDGQYLSQMAKPNENARRLLNYFLEGLEEKGLIKSDWKIIERGSRHIMVRVPKITGAGETYLAELRKRLA